MTGKKEEGLKGSQNGPFLLTNSWINLFKRCFPPIASCSLYLLSALPHSPFRNFTSGGLEGKISCQKIDHLEVAAQICKGSLRKLGEARKDLPLEILEGAMHC